MISTYSNRGTLKIGCVPSEHAIIYFSGTDPQSCYIQGEREAGMFLNPIEVVPASSDVLMKRESRIRFSKTIPVEMNVKVKDIGRVHLNHMSALVSYWQDRRDSGLGLPVTKSQLKTLEPFPTVERNADDGHQIQVQSGGDDNFLVDGLKGINSELIGDLHSGLS
jgi:hypothetical protein